MTATTTDTGYEELAAAIRGDLTRPGDPGYDQARAVYNAMIDKHPQAIVRVRDTADVITCVRFARARAIPVAVRAAATTRPAWASRTTPSSSTCRCCAAPPSTRTAAPSAPTPDAPGATSTTPPWRSVWPPRPASWPPPGWPG